MDTATGADGGASLGERLTIPRTLMLVSDRADAIKRTEVADDRRPCPEYLRLEKAHHVELLDWSRLPRQGLKRNVRVSLDHVRAALPLLRDYEVVFSDGEHVGIPLSLAMRAFGVVRPHLVLGHHLTTPLKRPFFRYLKAQHGMDRILLHSREQLDQAERYGIPSSKLALVPYFADTDFWRSLPIIEEPLVVSAGREYRDYKTLAAACGGMPEKIFVAAASVHSPGAHWSAPVRWPANFEHEAVDFVTLRNWYARASVIVIPLLKTNFQAGVTTLLEAMAMGKPVIVTGNRTHRELVEDGVDGVLVPAADPYALRSAIQRLLDRPEERRRLGIAARAKIVSSYGLNPYCTTLAKHLRDLAATDQEQRNSEMERARRLTVPPSPRT